MRVLLLGSSSVESAAAPLVIELRAALPSSWQIIPAGRRGWSIASWISSWPGAAPAELDAVDLVLVYLPGNGHVRPGQVSQLHRLISSATRARVLWALPPSWPAPLNDHGLEAARVRASVLGEGVPLYSAAVQLRASDLAADGVHLVRAGARKVAGAWAAALRSSSSGVGGWAFVLVLAYLAWRSQIG